MIQRQQEISVYGVIVKDHQILLVQKSSGPHKGLWDLPGGKIQFGESPDTTLIREILEETGLEVSEVSYLKSDAQVINYNDPELGKMTLHLVGFIFKVKPKNLFDLAPKEDDVDLICTKWCDYSELEVETLSPFLQELLLDGIKL